MPLDAKCNVSRALYCKVRYIDVCLVAHQKHFYCSLCCLHSRHCLSSKMWLTDNMISSGSSWSSKRVFRPSIVIIIKLFSHLTRSCTATESQFQFWMSASETCVSTLIHWAWIGLSTQSTAFISTTFFWKTEGRSVSLLRLCSLNTINHTAHTQTMSPEDICVVECFQIMNKKRALYGL